MSNLIVTTSNDSTLFELFTQAAAPLITDNVFQWLDTFFNSLIFSFGILGVLSNSINIRVFAHQGLNADSNTVCLFALAIADLIGCLVLIPYTTCEVIKYGFRSSPHLLVTCKTLTGYCFHAAHIGMSRVTCWITVYIAIERCLCVLIPFRAKLILRPRLATVAMVAIYVILFAGYVPVFINIDIKWRFHLRFNATVAVVRENEVSKAVLKYISIIANTVVSPIAAIIIVIATALMLFKLFKYRKWRQEVASTSTGNAERGEISKAKESSAPTGSSDLKNAPATNQAKRDIEVLKMVVMVTGLFLACLALSSFPGYVATFVSGFSFTGVNRNAYILLYLYKNVFDLINSSLNFFFYVRISSRYRSAFNEVFRKRSVRELRSFT